MGKTLRNLVLTLVLIFTAMVTLYAVSTVDLVDLIRQLHGR